MIVDLCSSKAPSNETVVLDDSLEDKAIEIVLKIVGERQRKNVSKVIRNYCRNGQQIDNVDEIVDNCFGELDNDVIDVDSDGSGGEDELKHKSHDSSRKSIRAILDVFPDASHEAVLKLCEQFNGEVNSIIQHMADKGYEKEKNIRTPFASEEESDEPHQDFTSTAWETSNAYRSSAIMALEIDFPFLRLPGLRKVFEKNNHHYSPTVKELEALLQITAQQIKGKNLSKTQYESFGELLKGSELQIKKSFKIIVNNINSMDPVLQQEKRWMKSKKREEDENKDRLVAQQLNVTIAEEEGGLFECGCCCSEYPFESIIQCSEGHLFCTQCLQSYTEQTVFGNGRSQLKCMNTAGEGCTGYYTEYMLEKSLPPKVMKKYLAAQAQDAVKAANLDNLISCHHCQLQVEMSEDAGVVLQCPHCGKVTCRKCGEEGHVPLRCEEVEKKTQTETRLLVEEAMTKARLRQCHKCKAKFYKVEGCNKMTCACGAYICYLCREDISKQMYQHFCQTAHCDHKSCGKCRLYSDALYDDRLAMLEAGQTALKKSDAEADSDGKVAGAAPIINLDALLEGGKLKKQKTAEVPRGAPAAPYQFPLLHAAANFAFGGGGGGGYQPFRAVNPMIAVNPIMIGGGGGARTIQTARRRRRR